MGMWMKQSLDHRPPQPSWNDNRDHFNFGDVVGNLADEETHLSGFQHQPSTSEDTFRFDNLSPDTEYEVKIKARNSYGWSDNEPHFVFKTSHRGEFSTFFVINIEKREGQHQQHTVRNLHFLSKNSTLISRENCRFLGVKNS